MHVQFLQLLLCRLDRRYRFRRGRCCLGSFMLCGYEKGRLMNPRKMFFAFVMQKSSSVRIFSYLYPTLKLFRAEP